MADSRPYRFRNATEALCGTCLRRVQAKEIEQDGCIYLLKRCPVHGEERVLLADDLAYWRLARETFIKPGEQVRAANTPHRWGCPYDCGICPEHEQHGCLTLLELTDACNLRCPTCYAGSGPHRQSHRSLQQLESMLDRIVANEGEPDVVQLSGGEPTLHPEFFHVVRACRQRPIRHLMLNTNGIRIADDEGFLPGLEAALGTWRGFEVYLQFDSLQAAPLHDLRGADLRRIRQRALERLEAAGVSTTLVVTVKRGVNDGELGAIIEHARKWRCVRGVTFQPVQDAGRNERYSAPQHRLTLTEVRRRIAAQSPYFEERDLVPVPCHGDCIAMGYALRDGEGLRAVSGNIDPAVLLAGDRATIAVERDPALRQAVLKAYATNHSPQSAASALHRLLCCLPGVAGVLEELSYQQVFRVIIMQFLDRHSLDLRAVRKSCVHIAHPDGRRIIPFDTYNILYRDGLEQQVLAPLRAAQERGWPAPATPTILAPS